MGQQVMMMFSQDNLFKARARSILLCMLMVLSTTAALATTASASQARTYTTNRDPHDVAIGDFNCDGHNDIAVATDGTHTITVLWNDGNGDFSERQDIWVSANQNRDTAEWDEFSNVQFIEVGEFTGDSATDIVIFQRNNPFKTNDDGSPAGEPGNVTIIENGGCNEKTWSIGARFTHFWAWDLEVTDLNNDGNDDVMVLDLQADITTQRVVTYLGPVGSSTQGIVTNLGPSQQNTYRAFTSGDWGESQVGGGIGGGGQCFDNDMWLLRSEGLDYATGQVTNPGKDDNVSIVEFNCQTNSFPLSYTFSTTPTSTTEHVINMDTPTSQAIAVADIDGDGVADVMALNDENLLNVTYVTSSSSGTWSTPQTAYFGPYISWSLTIADLNGDLEPDFINPTIAFQQQSTDSAGGTTNNFFLNFPTSIQVTLSDGNGGHLNPLSYAAGRRPHTAEVGQLAG
ncbi:MAG: VCBS repeat-containing protein, partial [Candidatus Thermoplasmatota archaeon]|nr:VCBS repeat-containing protein [Candidatus Thermoplasmatota archaeon]